MVKSRYINIVATDCGADVEDRFNTWYDENHVPLLMKYPGIKKVTRYKVRGDAPAGARYIAVYEYDSPEAMAGLQESDAFKEAMAEMQESWPQGGIEIKWAGVYEPLKTWG